MRQKNSENFFLLKDISSKDQGIDGYIYVSYNVLVVEKGFE